MVLPGRIIPIIGVASFRKCSYCSDMERKIIDTAASQQKCCGAVFGVLEFCGILRPFCVTFSYILSYATFLEKEPV